MTSENFAYWLQGFFEIKGTESALTLDQTKIIQNHLNLVFQHDIDPKTYPDPIQSAVAQDIHDGLIKVPPYAGLGQDSRMRC